MTRARRIRASILIPAPPDAVSLCYRDVPEWPALFPTIAATRIVSRSAHRVIVMVSHRQAGRVVNRLTWHSPRSVVLRESRRCFDAVFNNRFERHGDGTLYTVEAVLRFRGACRVFACVPARWRATVIRRRLERFVLRPMRAAFDSDQARTHAIS